MRRLVDDGEVDSTNELLADLVRATTRIEPDPHRRQRVLSSVRCAQRSAWLRLRAAAAAVLLASSAGAAATVDHVAVRARRLGGLSGEPPAQIAVALERASVPRRNSIDVLEAPATPAEPSLAPTTSAEGFPLSAPAEASRVPAPPAAASIAALRTGERLAIRPVHSWPPRDIVTGSMVKTMPAIGTEPGPAQGSTNLSGETSPVPPTKSTTRSDLTPLAEREDASQVVEAISALRNYRDGVRSGALLAEYLRVHPHGVLAEDALALSIEAAACRHDSKSARQLGRRYVTLFPAGRFRAIAVQAAEAWP